jgi:glycosyltransferase involved in cell wall biosynthesis
MKLLYLSCHKILEYDELRLFNELGIKSFCCGGAYTFNDPGSSRPKIENFIIDGSDVEAWHKMNSLCDEDSKLHLTKEFVDRFDIIYVMHPRWIDCNWDAIKHKLVVWRTIGQSDRDVERVISKYRSRLKIIRYSPKERMIPGYCGEDCLIRFSKRKEEYSNWTGDKKRLITVAQSMKDRHEHCCWNQFEMLSKTFPTTLFGNNNSASKLWNGKNLSYDELYDVYRKHRVFFYGSTIPASYTLAFIEAFMTGIPIVSVSNELGNFKWLQNTFEIPEIIENGVNGYCSDTIGDLKKYIQMLLENYSLAKKISKNARKMAIKLFDEEHIKPQWNDFFNSI